MALSPQHSPRVLAFATLPALPRHDPHVTLEIATSFLLFKDVAADRCMADAADALLL